MITIFSVPKKFEGHFEIIQRNAITSWTKFSPKPEIILFGNDKGTAEICGELNLKHVPQIERNEYNTPLLNDIFQKAQRLAKYDTLLFIMADIILLTNPILIIEKVKKKFNKFLLVGQRYEIKLPELINLKDKNWREKLTNDYIQKSKPKGPSWMDYFIFSKNIFSVVPPFAIGRTFWDKWLVWYAGNNNIPVIDCSSELIAIHQTHDYSHAVGNSRSVWEGAEARNNIRLAGGWTHGKNISNSTYIIQNRSVHKNYHNYKLASQIMDILKDKIGKYERLNPFILKTRSFLNRI